MIRNERPDNELRCSQHPSPTVLFSVHLEKTSVSVVLATELGDEMQVVVDLGTVGSLLMDLGIYRNVFLSTKKMLVKHLYLKSKTEPSCYTSVHHCQLSSELMRHVYPTFYPMRWWHATYGASSSALLEV